jgi:hypothetical protein
LGFRSPRRFRRPRSYVTRRAANMHRATRAITVPEDLERTSLRDDSEDPRMMLPSY